MPPSVLLLTRINLVQYLVHFDSSGTSIEALTRSIQSAGSHVSSYIPDNTLLVVAPSQRQAQLQTILGVVWVGEFLPEYRVAPEVHQLASWLSSQPSALLVQQHFVNQTAAMPNARLMHAFVYHNSDDSPYVLLDISFPHHLPHVLGQLESALQTCSRGNLTEEACMAEAVLGELGRFYPSLAAAADWQAALERLCDSQCSSAAAGAERLVVTVPTQHLQVCSHS